MQIDDAISCLQQAKKRGAKHIILAMWEADMFGKQDDGDWAAACGRLDENFDWSHTHEALEVMLNEDERL
jgi:hypothetical protein